MTLRPRAATVGDFSLFTLGVNGIVGVGIFFTPSTIAGLVPGSRGALVYPLTFVLLLPIAFCVSMLGQKVRLDGGPFVWARVAFGDRVAVAVGWTAALSAVLSTAAVLAGLADALVPALGLAARGARLPLGISVLLLLGAFAARGLRFSAQTWDALTMLKLCPLLFLLVLLFTSSSPASVPAPAGTEPEWGRAVLVALFPMQGFEIVPLLAGSARGRRFGIAVATIGSLLFATMVYAGLHLACVRGVPNLASDSTPLVAAGRALGGPTTERVVEVGTNLSAVGIAFAMVAMTPRYLAVLGVPSGFGSWLSATDARGVPRRALGVCLVAIAGLLVWRGLQALLVLSSMAVLVQYSTAALALAALALSRRHGLSPWAALPALAGLVALGFLASAARLSELLFLGVALFSGFLMALIRGRGASPSSVS